MSNFNENQRSKASRGEQTGIKLAMAAMAGNLALASSVTITLLLGMVLVLILSIQFIIASENPQLGLTFSLILALIFNVAIFFLSPFLMDLTQKWLYKTRWVSLDEIRYYSKESAEVIERVCKEKNIKHPKLGIIDDQNPTAFTYGSLPNTARLVVSQGLFTYLDDDEAATVYAHELGHIVHWDFAVMTLASTLVQISYLIYVSARNANRFGEKAKDAAQIVVIVAYVFYIVGTYLILYLSRTREYYADHFAAETTGNPNGLSRALVKIAYGILEEGQKNKEPSRLIEGTRALGIYDHKAAISTGTAYRIASDTQKVGKVFLWDLFNPWGWWMELNSTHPLTGKRVRALSNYAEQMGLDMEFDMGLVINEGNNLSKGKLYSSFFFDIFIYQIQFLAIIGGLIIGGIIAANTENFLLLIAIPLIAFGVATAYRTFIMYPRFQNAPIQDIFTLMCDPYASPLRGKPVQLQGKLIGRGDAGYQFGSDLKLQDKTGMIFARYFSRFGSVGNFFFGASQVNKLIDQNVQAVGWFRRGIMPWYDLTSFHNEQVKVTSHPRFWSFMVSFVAIAIGFFLLFLKLN